MADENTTGTNAGAGGTASAGSAAAASASGAASGAPAAGGGAPAAGSAGSPAGGASGGSTTAQGAAAQGGAGERGWWESGGKLELKPPQGMELSPEWSEKLTKIAAERKMSAEQVNAMLPLALDLLSERDKKISETVTKQWEKTEEDWRTKGLPAAFGGNEAQYAQGKKDAALVMEKFADKETLDLMKSRYLRFDPVFAKFTARIGAFIREKISEDSSHVEGAHGGSGAAPVTPKQRRVNALYVNNPPPNAATQPRK